MKYIITLVFAMICESISAQSISAVELRSVLIQQLKNSHDTKAWYVPANVAVEGLTAEQASWRDGSGNHSVGQLVYHIVYWNKGNLEHFQGKETKQPNSNEETFNSFDQKQWTQLVKDLDQVMKDLEALVLNAPEDKLREFAPTIANIGSHNAYHIGQIIFVRKLQKSQGPEKRSTIIK